MEHDLADQSSGAERSLTAGKLLNRKRLDRGFDLADVARATRIPLRNLEAIEQDEHDRLPAYPYAVGFVRNYAKYLGLAPDAIVSQFKSETTLMDPTLTATVPEPLDESRMPSRTMVVLGILGVAAALAAAGYYYSRQTAAPATGAAVEATPAPEAETPASPAGAPVMSDSAAPPVGQPMVPPPATVTPDPAAAAVGAPATTTALPAPTSAAPAAAGASAAAPATPAAAMPAAPTVGISPVGVVLRANQDSWIKVSDGTSPSLRTGILKAGDTYTVPNVPGLKLLTGNAGGLDVFVNGKQLPPLGRPGTTVKGLSLDPTQLQARATTPVPQR